jgi:hypothetical protein
MVKYERAFAREWRAVQARVVYPPPLVPAHADEVLVILPREYRNEIVGMLAMAGAQFWSCRFGSHADAWMICVDGGYPEMYESCLTWGL